MAQSNVSATTDLVKEAISTAANTTEAAVGGVAASAIATLQLARNLVDSVEGVAELGIDFSADTIDSAIAKLQDAVRLALGGK